MKKFPGIAFIISLMVVTFCCKKSISPISNSNNNINNNNGNTNNNTPGLVTPKGFPTGSIVSKFITAAGGSITTMDGRVELDFPSGSLPNGDTITIMNISNNGPGGIGDAYRFLPEGLKFANPVTVKFHYNDTVMNGTLPQLTHIAYQDSSGEWVIVENNVLDTVAKTFTVSTTHFSDWDIFPDLYIFKGNGDENQKNEILVSGHQQYFVYYIPTNSAGHIINSNLFADVSSAILKNWTVNNIVNGNFTFGTITPGNNANTSDPKISCSYMAPAQVPPGGKTDVAISAKLQNLSYLDPKYGSFNNLTLTHFARIVGANFTYNITIDYQDTRIDGGLPGLAFTASDHASFTVTVKDGKDVTVSNFDNQAETVSPGSQSSDGCTSTSNDTGDYLDITSATGSILAEMGSPTYVEINYFNTGTTYPSFKVVCSGAGQTVGGQAIGNSQDDFDFVMKDSAQTINSAGTQMIITITPQH